MMTWKPEFKKPMLLMLLGVAILFGGIFIYKEIASIMLNRFFAAQGEPTVAVSTMKVAYQPWQPMLKASGSTRAIKGVFVTAQLSGMISDIYFKPGAIVEKDTALVQQNVDTDIAQLHVYQANAELARITFNRDKVQFKFKAVSKQQLDTDEQNLKSLLAQVEQQASTVRKKTIAAPFTGRLGISQVNPGQYLNPGDQIVMLQTLDPIYVDFYLPQQTLAQLAVGQSVFVTSGTFPGKTFSGQITTINPAVDVGTRNIEVEATLPNPNMELTPGMFTTVEVHTGTPKPYLTLPQTAVTFNTYGDLVYLVKPSDKSKTKKSEFIARQAFVETGGTRGDQIIILKGIKEGDTVITSGQLKLKNGTPVAVNNTVTPSNSQHPSTPDEHEG